MGGDTGPLWLEAGQSSLSFVWVGWVADPEGDSQRLFIWTFGNRDLRNPMLTADV